MALALQIELVRDNRQPYDTAAGRAMHADILDALEEFQKEIERLRVELDTAAANNRSQLREELREAQRLEDRLKEERDRLGRP